MQHIYLQTLLCGKTHQLCQCNIGNRADRTSPAYTVYIQSGACCHSFLILWTGCSSSCESTWDIIWVLVQVSCVHDMQYSELVSNLCHALPTAGLRTTRSFKPGMASRLSQSIHLCHALPTAGLSRAICHAIPILTTVYPLSAACSACYLPCVASVACATKLRSAKSKQK